MELSLLAELLCRVLEVSLAHATALQHGKFRCRFSTVFLSYIIFDQKLLNTQIHSVLTIIMHILLKNKTKLVLGVVMQILTLKVMQK